jgi:uncharacterized membrane protein SirB2
MLAELISGALAVLPTVVPNCLAVLGAALLSVIAVSFFRGETTVFTNLYQVIIFVTGTLNPILGILGGIGILLRAQRRREEDQRELAVLFTLVFFAIAYYYGLVRIPEFTVAS